MKRLLIALLLAGCSPNISQEPDQPTGEGEQAETGVSDVSMELTLNDLEPGDEVTSPLRFSGSASGLWYFEGDFPVRIFDGQGNVIAESYASSQSNWMTEEQVPFEGEITFNVTEPTEATLIFQEDDPSGMNVPAEHPVAVVLVPSAISSKSSHRISDDVYVPEDARLLNPHQTAAEARFFHFEVDQSLADTIADVRGGMTELMWREQSPREEPTESRFSLTFEKEGRTVIYLFEPAEEEATSLFRVIEVPEEKLRLVIQAEPFPWERKQD